MTELVSFNIDGTSPSEAAEKEEEEEEFNDEGVSDLTLMSDCC